MILKTLKKKESPAINDILKENEHDEQPNEINVQEKEIITEEYLFPIVYCILLFYIIIGPSVYLISKYYFFFNISIFAISTLYSVYHYFTLSFLKKEERFNLDFSYVLCISGVLSLVIFINSLLFDNKGFNLLKMIFTDSKMIAMFNEDKIQFFSSTFISFFNILMVFIFSLIKTNSRKLYKIKVEIQCMLIHLSFFIYILLTKLKHESYSKFLMKAAFPLIHLLLVNSQIYIKYGENGELNRFKICFEEQRRIKYWKWVVFFIILEIILCEITRDFFTLEKNIFINDDMMDEDK